MSSGERSIGVPSAGPKPPAAAARGSPDSNCPGNDVLLPGSAGPVGRGVDELEGDDDVAHPSRGTVAVLDLEIVRTAADTGAIHAGRRLFHRPHRGEPRVAVHVIRRLDV